MKKNFLWLALPACAISIACAQPAAAAPVSYTYTGSVDIGQDDFGLFGSPGAILNGAAFTAVFTRDDDLADPGSIFIGENGSVISGYEGHTPITASLIINGVAFSFADEGFQSQYDDGLYEGFGHSASALGNYLNLDGGTFGTFAPMAGFNYLPGPDYHTLASFDLADRPGFYMSGRFEYGMHDVEGRTYANLRPTHLFVSPDPGSPTGAVPEPATWAMMILGFGGVGATLRRRGRVAFA